MTSHQLFILCGFIAVLFCCSSQGALVGLPCLENARLLQLRETLRKLKLKNAAAAPQSPCSFTSKTTHIMPDGSQRDVYHRHLPVHVIRPEHTHPLVEFCSQDLRGGACG